MIMVVLPATAYLGRHSTSPSLKRAELPPIRFHASPSHLRYNTPHGRQAPKVRPGTLRPRRSINFTLDTYSHVIEGMDGGLADAMDDAL